jgi:hypothetical protein
MNADEFDRELEDALRTRVVSVAPPEFTQEVIRRVAGARSQRPLLVAASALFVSGMYLSNRLSED